MTCELRFYSNLPGVALPTISVISFKESNFLMQERMHTLGRWSVWLCLMLWVAAAESIHHPDQTEAGSCSIWGVARTASPALSSSHIAAVFAAVRHLQENRFLAEARLDVFNLDIRGSSRRLGIPFVHVATGSRADQSLIDSGGFHAEFS
jgi:hypothetical protein